MSLQFPDFTCKGTHTFKMGLAHMISLQFLNKPHMDKLSAEITVEANNLEQISSNPYPELENYCISIQKQELHLTDLPSFTYVPPTYHETKLSKSGSFHSPAPCHVPKFIFPVLPQQH